MGRKLTYSQRLAREREKERERLKNAARREKERTARIQKREAEREARKRANLKEKLASKRAKELEEEKNRKEAINDVNQYNDFVKAIKNLHLNQGLDLIKKAIKAISRSNQFDGSSIQEPSYPQKLENGFSRRRFSSLYQAEFDELNSRINQEKPFKRKKFISSDQAEFDDVSARINFDLPKYVAFNKKPLQTAGRQIFNIFLIALIGGLLTYYLKSDHEYIALGCLILTVLLSIGAFAVLGQIRQGDDKSYSSHKGFEKFISENKIRLNELNQKIIVERDEFDKNQELEEIQAANQSAQAKVHLRELEQKISLERSEFEKLEDARELQATRDYESYLERFKNEVLPGYERELDLWKQKVAKAEADHQLKEASREKWFEDLTKGDTGIMTEACELVFPVNYILDEDHLRTNPSEFDIGFGVLSSNHMQICIIIAEHDNFLPEFEVKLKPSGLEASEIINSEAKQREAGISVICGVVVGLIDLCLQILPSLQKIDAEVNISSIDTSTGDSVNDVVVTMSITREEFGKIKLGAIDPVETVKKFAQGFKMPESKKRLEPIINKDDLLWSSNEDDKVEVNTYVAKIFNRNLRKIS